MWQWEGVIITSIYSYTQASSPITAHYVTIKLPKNVAWIDTWSPNYTQVNQGYVILNRFLPGYLPINPFQPCLMIQDSSGFVNEMKEFISCWYMHVQLGVVSSQMNSYDESTTPSTHLKFLYFIVNPRSLSTSLLNFFIWTDPYSNASNNIGRDQYTKPFNFKNWPVHVCAQLMLWSGILLVNGFIIASPRLVLK